MLAIVYTNNMATAQTQEAKVVTSKSDGVNKFTKIALIALAVVFLIIISEVAYFIIVKNGVPFLNFGETAQQEESERSTANLPLRSTISPPQAKQEKDISVDSSKARVFADMLDSLANNNKLKPSDIAIIYFETSGTVITSDHEEREINGLNYTYHLTIKKSDSTMSYWFNEEDISGAQILLITLPESSEILMTDIKPGDDIIIKSTMDLLDASVYSSLVLEVRRQR